MVIKDLLTLMSSLDLYAYPGRDFPKRILEGTFQSARQRMSNMTHWHDLRSARYMKLLMVLQPTVLYRTLVSNATASLR